MTFSGELDITVSFEDDRHKVRALQQALTAQLPEWFSSSSSNRHYAEQAETLPGWIARVDGHERGLLLLKRHGEASAEIYWLAVAPRFHRHGVGKALLDAVTGVLVNEKRKLLFAYTLGAASANEYYRRTRKFYERQGFSLALTPHGSAAEAAMAYYVKFLEP
jgi:ribosomal protein S18 acetylase RimI-like enzyme